jgi:Cu(I)/Ag(I) efflux system membrane fusion protein
MNTEHPDRPAPAEPTLTRWQKFRLVVKVVELRLRFIALMAATGLIFGYWDTIWNHYEKWTRPAGDHLAAASDIEYFCPMHPNVVRDHPGNCPICGMPLSKRAKGAAEPLPEGVTARLSLPPNRVKQAGVQAVAIGYAPLTERLTTVGQVGFDERRLARIASRTKGLARVEKLMVNFTGTTVQAGEPLAELYSPELYQAVRELLLAQKNAAERARHLSGAGRSLLGGDGGDLVALAREKLSLWGITPRQIDAILASGEAEYRLPILSPISGVVVRKNVVEGQYVAEGEAMFEVADLSRVWVQAQVYEDQVGQIAEGQAVEATVPAYPGEVFRGTVAFVDPVLNPATRTLGVRYDLENPDGRLRPGMYVTVTLETPIAEMPAFRERFAKAEASRPVRRAAGSAAEQKVCLVTGNELGTMGEPIPVEVEGEKVWICCAACEKKLRWQPARYLAASQPPPKDAVLTVPESAVIDTGARKVVYVETEPGVFEGREVVLGPRSGDLFPVLDGLVPGDRVATAGAFLIDAESRLNPAFANTGASNGPTRAAAIGESKHPH